MELDTSTGSKITQLNGSKAVLTVPEAAQLLRISRNLAYELVQQNALPHVRLGRRILIPRRVLEGWMEREASMG